MPAYKGEHEDILKPFLDAMRYKLAANKHKGKRFEDLTFETMFELLQGEVAELKEALEGGNQFEIMFEAADIANFALFVATKAIRQAGQSIVKPRIDGCSECGCTAFSNMATHGGFPKSSDRCTCGHLAVSHFAT